MATRGTMYINLRYFLGGQPENFSFMQFSKNIDGFGQNNSHGY